MQLQEFETLTGFYPPDDLWKAIESAYMRTPIGKEEFCRAYKENEDGLAEKIQREVIFRNDEICKNWAEQRDELGKKVYEQDRQIRELREQIRRLEGWKPHDISRLGETAYNDLWNHSGKELDTEEKTVAWISEEFGFSPEKIKVHYQIPRYMINKNGMIAKTGEFETRRPAYMSTDWNYVRFDVFAASSYFSYEVVDGELYKYED